MTKTISKKVSPWVVLKFGGTSVSSLKCWETIAGVIADRRQVGFRPVVVCSALSGISDQLEKLLDEAVTGKHEQVLKNIEQRHLEFAAELDVKPEIIQDELALLGRLTTGISLVGEATPKIKAQVLSCGEIMLTKLGHAYLRKNDAPAAWLDAREHLVSREMPHASDRRNILCASCEDSFDPRLTETFTQENAAIILTQGFIARDSHGDTVLLGRGGSDVSAAYFAAKLKARLCEIWTDVPGMYTANPHQVPSARLLKMLDYDEAQEISSSGAKVLHPRCLAPLRKNNIPLKICYLGDPKLEGTLISNQAKNTAAQVKAISSRQNITLLSLETIDMWHQVGFLASVFDCFRRHGLSIDLVSTSESNVSVTLDPASNTLDKAALKSLLNDLNGFCQTQVIDSCALVSLVGRNIRAILHQLAPALSLFEEQKIYLLSQAANDLNLTFVVDQDQAPRLVSQLHDELMSKRAKETHLGPTWAETFKKEVVARKNEVDASAWWYRRRTQLLELASENTPLYVYDEESIEERLEDLKKLGAVDRHFYAVKANAHHLVLNKCYQAGLGFECVSPGEVEHIFKNFPDIDPQRIIFTPNFAPRKEYEYALAKKVLLTLDNLYPLENWPEVFKKQNIIVRLDPGQGRGHHKYVHTAGAKSKFGVAPAELARLAELTQKHGVQVIGLHAHVGSNIFKTDTWSETALFLAEIAQRFPQVKILDVGGGLGVVEKPGQSPLNLAQVDQNLAKVKALYPNYEIWMEPGRFVVANAGVLLAQVTQTKQKEEYYYVGLNAGMNTLIRPALYGSYHEIINLTRPHGQELIDANIVGPICESGDILGYSRQIVSPQNGDVLLINTVGAYGRVMSSNYNLRQPAGEYFLPSLRT